MTWVRACTITSPAAGRIEVVVSPAPADATQRAELAEAIFSRTAYGIRWDGTDSEVVEKPDGTTDTVKWSYASTQAVTVVVSGLTFATGVDPDEARAALTAEIIARFADLKRGETLRFLRMIGALDVIAGITGGSVTLDGGTSDVVPVSSTTLLVLDGDEPTFA